MKPIAQIREFLDNANYLKQQLDTFKRTIKERISTQKRRREQFLTWKTPDLNKQETQFINNLIIQCNNETNFLEELLNEFFNEKGE